MYEQRNTIRQVCTPFCTKPCQHAGYHHPLLVAILNSSSEAGFAEFEETLSSWSKRRTWNRDDPIPDGCPEFRYPVVHWAAVLGKVKVLKWCIHKKFNIHKRCGHRGETALHRLAVCGYSALQEKSQNVYRKFEEIVDVLEELLDSRDDNQDTPLHVASKVLVEQQNTSVYEDFDEIYPTLVKIIVQKTYQLDEKLLNCQNNEGNTPLHILSATNNCLNLVRMMVQYGANCNLKNEEKQNALDIAELNKAYDISKLFPITSKEKHSNHTGSKLETPLEPEIILVNDSDDEYFGQNDNFKQEHLEDLLRSIKNELPGNEPSYLGVETSPEDFQAGEVSLAAKNPAAPLHPYLPVTGEIGNASKRKSSSARVKEPVVKKLKENLARGPTMASSSTLFIVPVQQFPEAFKDVPGKDTVSQPMKDKDAVSQPMKDKDTVSQPMRDKDAVSQPMRDKDRNYESDVPLDHDLLSAEPRDSSFTQSLHLRLQRGEHLLERDPQTETRKDNNNLLEKTSKASGAIEGFNSSSQEILEQSPVGQETEERDKSRERISCPSKQDEAILRGKKHIEDIVSTILNQKMVACKDDYHHMGNIASYQAAKDEVKGNVNENVRNALTASTKTSEFPSDAWFNHQQTDTTNNFENSERGGTTLVNVEGSLERTSEFDKTEHMELPTGEF